VHDTGVGIRPEDLDRIFEPFDQVSEVLAPGAGLGLAIATRLVNLHGGGLTVTSAHGAGSVFRITLPEHGQPSERREGARAGPDPQLPLRVPGSSILVVEDDLTALGLVADVLVRSGYVVRTATDIAGAIDALAVAAPSLVLLDMRLGAEDGLDLARRLRADPATRTMPILALSADAMQHDVERVLDAGCNAHLAKPVVARDLLKRIHALLEPATAAGGEDASGVPTSAGGPAA
jgi:CheY-like chemotaxis protein